MTAFRYRALASGHAISGWLEAGCAAEARAVLRDRGLVVLRVRARPHGGRNGSAVGRAVATFMRRRRVAARADLFDDLGALLYTSAAFVAIS